MAEWEDAEEFELCSRAAPAGSSATYESQRKAPTKHVKPVCDFTHLPSHPPACSDFERLLSSHQADGNHEAVLSTWKECVPHGDI